MPNSCPSPNTLAGYLSGKASDNQAESIENHLVNCLQCQEQLESLSEEPDSLMRMIADGVVPQLVASGTPDSPRSSAPIPYSTAQHATSNAINSDDRSPSQGTSVGAESVTMIRDYRLMECIGQGGMGSVYRAFHLGMNRQVALKILKSDRMASAEAVCRFKREIELLAKLDNPHIVRALDAGEHDGLPYFVMEFVSGIDLSQLVRRVGPLPAREACQIARQAATALQYAHEQKVIHRDVKPSNLMITAESNIKLLDLGLAQILDLTVQESLTQANQALGTLAYMAPEQLSGRLPITQQSDIFSLGVTLHVLLTGQRPFERSGLPPLVSDLKSIRPDIAVELNALVGSMLALSPADRPASMSEVVARLSTFAASAELPALLAEYYRWNHRTFSPPISAFAQAETDPSQAASTDGQSVRPQPVPNDMLVIPPASGQRNNRSRFRWLTGSACGCILALYGFSSWHDAQPVIPVISTGAMEIIAEGDLPLQIVEEGFVQLENIGTGKMHHVNLGTNKLQPGTYRLDYDRAPEAFRDGGNATFDIFADSPSKLLIQPILAHRFQFPVIPTQAGAYASYRGTFWRAPWAETEAVPYELNLEVLSISQEPDLPVRLWLMIEIWHQDCGYTETAYLQISAHRWESYQEFEVTEGWLEAQSPSIATYKLLCGQAGTRNSVVVPFELQRDTLGDIALLPLPEQRLSVHDVVALFFGEKSLAAAASITRLRADLSQSKGRNEWLENGSFGACYVASSRRRGAATTESGYSLHRRESDQYNPYGFVALEVKMPGILTAECILVKGSASPSLASAVNNLLEELRSNAFHIGDAIALTGDRATSPLVPPATAPSTPKNGNHYKTLKQDSPGSLPLIYGIHSLLNQFYFCKSVWRGLSLPTLSGPPIEQPQPAPSRLPQVENDGKPFDLASMPEKPSIMTWSGIVELDSQHPEEIAVTARMLHSIRLQSDGRECKWIEVEVTARRANSQPYTEVARVLVDAEAYEKSNEFVIVQANRGLQGWIAYGSKNTILPIPADGDLESLVDLRLQFEPHPQFDRIGVSHVLSMLFGAALKPDNEISELRRTMGRIMAGRQRTCTEQMYPRKTGAGLPSLCWESPMATRLLGSYRIYRSPEAPFGFVDVELRASGINIDLNMGDRYGPLPDDYRLSYFGTTDDFSELLRKQQDGRRAVPNWRVWTWRDGGRIYKAFAEFGGTIESAGGSDVLLRDANNKQTRVPIKLLADVDKASLSVGRLWAKESFGDTKLSLWRVLAQDDNTDQLVLTVPSNNNMLAHVSWQHLTKDDQQWVTKLRTARKSSWDNSHNQAEWTAFAGYVGQ